MEVADAFARSNTKTNLVQANKKINHQFKQTYSIRNEEWAKKGKTQA